MLRNNFHVDIFYTRLNENKPNLQFILKQYYWLHTYNSSCLSDTRVKIDRQPRCKKEKSVVALSFSSLRAQPLGHDFWLQGNFTGRLVGGNRPSNNLSPTQIVAKVCRLLYKSRPTAKTLIRLSQPVRWAQLSCKASFCNRRLPAVFQLHC